MLPEKKDDMGNLIKTLVVDLGATTVRMDQLDSDGMFGLGGKALGVRLFETYLDPKADPLSPANMVAIAPSPLAAYAFPGSNRLAAFSKSPLTGIWLEAYVGGSISRTLRETGWGAVVVTGAARKPVRLHITAEGAELLAADELWGLDSFETERLLLGKLDKRSGVLSIGPAGENQVRTASVMHEEAHAFGRGGLGAVFGSKMLKAITVSSAGPVKSGASEAFAAVRLEVSKLAASSPTGEKYRTYGTPMMVAIMDDAKAFPSGFFESGCTPNRATLEAEGWGKWAVVENDTCAPCPMGCRKKLTLTTGLDSGLKLHGPEYETLYSFGGSCMVRHARDIARLNERCNRLGMDSISTGNLVALAMKAKEEGKLARAGYSTSDIGAVPDPGEVPAIAAMLEAIARRSTRLGKLLSEGMDAAASELGMSDAVITSKGLDPAGYEPRRMKGMALSYALSPRGACHLRSTFYKAELTGALNGLDTEAIVSTYIDWEDRLLLADSLILCRFYRDFMSWERLSACVSQLAGFSVGREQLQELSKDILTRIRRLNFTMGLSSADDTLAPRFFKEATDSAPALDRSELEEQISTYWVRRGWGVEGVPPM
ncbi:MAG: hypothetical protein A3J97_00035 [Spirochaetes bacterium RIFOXYC1_FULL_54_7]|nr:MAG: hypothetical protein A3J97_00035 [Spirochaetes bacterium RIFOXYC1_FULL_54_7]